MVFNLGVKTSHTNRVVDLITKIADELGADITIATACGLLHDAGRFPQFSEYRTFSDSRSVNHAKLSALVVNESGILGELFNKSESEIIMLAILNHNKIAVGSDISADALLYTNMLRDADKLDILNIMVSHYESPVDEKDGIELGLPDLPIVTESVMCTAEAGEAVSYADMQCLNDFRILQIGWAADLNSPTACRIFRDARFVERIRGFLPTGARIDKLCERVTTELDRMIMNPAEVFLGNQLQEKNLSAD